MSDRTKPLAMRTRRIVGPRHEVISSTVRCPPRDASISTSECLTCADSAGVSSNSTGTYVRCTHPAAQHAALVELMKQPLFSSAADRTPLSEVMTRDVVCVLPDLRLADLTELFLVKNISGAPVVDGACRPLGVVSKTDLVGGFAEGATVADVMMPVAFTLPESATVSRAAALMAFEGIHRIPIVSSENRVIGIISSLDVARWLAQNDGYIAPGSNNLARRRADEGE
jgi:CBS domain-containing protein